jgi:hypothetical protein
MSRPNAHGLPQFLRKDGKGYFKDYYIKEGGGKIRKRVRLGPISLVQAKKILAQNMIEMVEGKFLPSEKAMITFAEAAEKH